MPGLDRALVGLDRVLVGLDRIKKIKPPFPRLALSVLCQARAKWGGSLGRRAATLAANSRADTVEPSLAGPGRLVLRHLEKARGALQTHAKSSRNGVGSNPPTPRSKVVPIHSWSVFELPRQNSNHTELD